MSIDLTAEKAKWDAIYNASAPAADSLSQTRFNAHLVESVLALLPAGGTSIEAGCGGGSQSLALARTGLFKTTLLDISEHALRHAKLRFDEAQIKADFIVGSALDHADPEFDLVFNNGTLEHYSFDEQVTFVKAMTSRSRRYVISIVPNAGCYWYWMWRLMSTAQGNWPYGTEVPVHSQADVFKAANLRNIRVSYLGEEWTEDMIASIDGMSSELRNAIIKIHRSPLIPHNQKCYLVATVGEIVDNEPIASPLWSASTIYPHEPAKTLSALADALSIQISGQLENARLSTQCSVLEAARNHLEEEANKARRSLRQVGSQLKSVSKLMVENALKHGDIDEKRQHALTELNQQRQANENLRQALHQSNMQLALAKRSPLLKAAYWVARRMPRDSGMYKLLHNGRRGLRKLRSAGFKHTLRLAIGRALQRVQMNPYEYAFDLYLRDREQSLPIRWDRIGVPHQPGLVTIVLPCYNGADLLRESLDSMLTQTYRDIEIIAINDGSSDATAETLEDYARRDSRITVLHQENRKLPRTLSRGFRQARGEFLTWTSVDNRMKPNCIAEMVESLRRNPDWDMIYANIDIIGEDGQPLRHTDWYSGYQVPPGSEHIHLPVHTTELNTWPNNYIGAAFMYRARVAWVIQDYSPIRFLTEDYDYWMRVNELMKLRHADFTHCIYDYRFHDNSLTSKDKELGITRSRVKLMVFDEFRRSFLLSKCVWSVSSDNSSAANRWADSLRRELAQRNVKVIDAETLVGYSLSKLWMPIAAVHFADVATAQPQSPPMPDSACRILVHTGNNLPQQPGDWDICVTTGALSGKSLPRIDDGYRGWFAISDIRDLCSFCDIETKNSQLAALELEIDKTTRPSDAGPAISVVICTYKRSTVLLRAIRSLMKQSLDNRNYEVIVVNNEPSEIHPRTLVETIEQEFAAHERPALRVVDCPIPGLSHARNVGLAESAGEYVIFIDDDAIANPDCIEWMYKAFVENPQAGVIGGHVRLNLPDPRPEVCPPGREALWSQFLTGHEQFTERTHWWEFPYGALWGARRSVLFEMGGFRCNLGRIGNDFGGGEEIVAAALAQKLGHKVAVEPRAEVLHDVEAHRYTLEHVQKTIQAAELVNYRMQISLHLPSETTLATALRSAASRQNLRGLLNRLFNSKKSTIEHIYTAAYAAARIKLLGERIRDFLRKFSRPRTSIK